MSGYPPSGRAELSSYASRILAFVFDLGIVIGAYALALYLRFDGEVPTESWRQLAWAGPLIGIAYILAYTVTGVYRTAWQYGSVRDAVLLTASVAVVTVSVFTVNALLPHRPIPLTVNVIGAAFILLFHGMVRLLPRLWSGSGIVAQSPSSNVKRVLIVGAGDTGQQLAAELQHNRTQPYRPVGFIDDDPSLRGKRVHGISVLGGRFEIPNAIETRHVDLVALALASSRSSELQEILALCEPFKIPVRLVPGHADVVAGRAQRGEMREITMEDLLARAPLDVDADACRAAIEGRTILITGAAGSIGGELARRIAQMGPAALHLVDSGETALHELRSELNNGALKGLVKGWLCSIADRQKLQDVFESSRPQVVFHLAAFKHIGMMEEHPDQAFETNVLGTLNVFEAAQEVRAEQVVFLSSHTAVNPASVYGATKRIGELLIASMPGPTRFCAVRLTNVIDSRGTVLTVFMRQIQQGNPITVTDPEVARYFLTISEVAGLVIQSAALSRGSEIFALDVGDEVRIGELAERLIRSHGLEPGADVPIIYKGLGPGEKLRENVIGENERLAPTSHPRVQQVVSSLSFSGAELRAGIKELEVDRRRRTGNIAARLHDLARFDRAEPRVSETTERQETRREP